MMLCLKSRVTAQKIHRHTPAARGLAPYTADPAATPEAQAHWKL